MKFKSSFITFLSLFFLITNTNANIKHSNLEILDQENALYFNNSLFFGIKISLEDGWKTYWKNPGDSGLPLKINTNSNVNLNILFPTPSRFVESDIETIGYEDEVIFPVSVENFQNTEEDIAINIDYLVCKKICIPVSLKRNIKFSKSVYKEKNKNELFEALLSLPSQDNQLFKFSRLISKNKKKILEFTNVKKIKYQNLEVFLWFKNENIKFKEDLNDNILKLTLIFDNEDEFDNESLEVLIKNKEISEIKKISLKNVVETQNLIKIILLAVLGGLILNFMPCVLPVLSLKILSFLKLAKKERTRVAKIALSSILGIFFSFLVLAIMTILFKEIGKNIGWGIQFQSKEFLLILALIVFLFSINLLGFFEIILPKSISKLYSLSSKNEYFNAFLSGLLATILATPCTAPFLGSSISYALTQNNFIIIIIFASLSFGFALPYFLIIFFPKLMNYLPKPGAWMVSLKRFLAFLLILTSIWLLNLSNILNDFVLITIIIMIGSLFIFKNNYVKNIFIKLLLLSFFSFTCYIFFKPDEPKLNWESFNKELMNRYISNEELIFLDVTADWCLTCKFNKIRTIESKKTIDFFKKNNIKLIKADWTNKNESISKFMEEKNKFGIPLNIVYGPSNKGGLILPEILSKDSIINALNLVK